jgi:hypothetical protein
MTDCGWPRIYGAVVLGLFSLVIAASASAQTVSPVDRSAGLAPGSPPSDQGPIIPESAMGQRKRPAHEVKPRYPSNPAGYPSSASRLRSQKVDPEAAAAQQQSGIGQAEATSLIRSRGYTGLGEVHADPNSVWVWQADAIKNGRPVHLGIDHRGNLLETSTGLARPCTQPGAGFATGSIGVGSRLSEATSCASR